ncbi:zinc transporter ZntB [Mucisphaera calidilacus]|uniref:Zinc transport protein ZntB n=1 Tax=Mucisphaera calidilacus TaxID=2527982 RepID=A0A518BY08_9BACT|nr:zinc transporter ZntB [Mucisphaera calidilacus]QDU71863.1 Zinc transport protein ZntB [Mucisphaera calidilacus]
MNDPVADGLIHAFVIDDAGTINQLASDALDDWRGEQGTLWAHFDRSKPATGRWLRDRSGLDGMVREALLAEDTRPRVTIVGEGAVVILRGVNLNPGAQPDDMISLRMWVDRHRLLSMRFPKLAAVGDVRERLLAGDDLLTSGALLAGLAIAMTDRMAQVMANLRELLDDFEEQTVEGFRPSLLEALGPVRRQVIVLRRYLSPQRDALIQLTESTLTWLTQEDRARLREALDRTTRFVEDLDSLRDRFVYVQEEMMAWQSQQLNTTMYLLSIVSTVFLPLSFLTGVLGMNVAGLPGTEVWWAFGGVVIVMIAMALAEVGVLWWWGLIGRRG